MIGNELIYPQRSLYLVIWVILRSLNHALALLFVFLVGASLSELPPEIPMYVPAYWITPIFVLLLQVGFTVGLFFRQASAYWLLLWIYMDIHRGHHHEREIASGEMGQQPCGPPAE